MSPSKTILLTHEQIEQKLQRLAVQVLEEHYDEKEIYIFGIQKRGYFLAEELVKKLEERKVLKVHLSSIKVNKRDPIADDVQHDIKGSLKDKVIILVDDVANTGRTLFYAMKPLMDQLPKSIEVLVLVDRQHKLFPVSADYVGMELATTMREHITLETGKETQVYLS
jgi:pyrimidine operon attenuation protein/uracil phosphoribosyltransferase